MPFLTKYGIDSQISRWLAGLAAFVLVTLVLFSAKRIVFRLANRGSAPDNRWIRSLIQTLPPAMSVAIIVAAFAVAVSFGQISDRGEEIINVLITAGAVLAVVLFIDGQVRFWTHQEAGRFPMLGESYGIVSGFIRGLVFGLGALMFLESVGISIGPLLATLGVGSLAIALALQETVKNTLSGFFVILDKPLEVGDYVKLASGQEGWLTQLGWRSSKFRMMNDNTVVVPNSQLVDTILTNLRAADGALSVEINLSVAGGTDLDQLEQVTKQVASEVMNTVEGGVPGFTPSIYFQSASAAAINFAVFLRSSRGAAIEQVKHEFLKRLTARYRQDNIKLA